MLTAGAGPASTYRLQLTADFGFAAVAGLAGYLASLGVSHAYLSPILQAVPGSPHGYDVTDHSRVRDELGGPDGFREMAAALRARGIGIIVDIVPNHMAVPAPEHLNPQLWSVLREGRGSAVAHWFDVDWEARDGRFALPILGEEPERAASDLSVEPIGPDGEPALRYFDHVLPLRPGTAGLPLRRLLEAQHYELEHWRKAATELNWRRFFDISSLIGIRVEDPDVFTQSHAVILDLVTEGLIDGLRVDHPDGLADPRGYFRRLAEATGGRWVVAEKILAAGEELPADWPVAGTTGYDVLALVDGLFTDPAGGGPLAGEYAAFCAQAQAPPPASRFADVAAQAKREVAVGSFGSEVARLARRLAPLLPEAADGDLREVVAELLAGFEVYRAYLHPGEPPAPQAAKAVGQALATAAGRLPARLRPLAEAAVAQLSAGPQPLVTLFGQCTGPVQAKGVEDTACYRWARLASLNEVGGDPDRFGLPLADFHAQAARLQASWPATMTTLSTHDTKRQEDVRARLAVLAEIPRQWGQRAARWQARAATLAPPVDAGTEYLLWQTLAGAWPLAGARLAGYLVKAMREAKRQTSWTSQDPAYEQRVLSLAEAALGDEWLAGDIAAFVAEISASALANSLGAKLVQLTMPGVPDTYQGCEVAGLSLVDPDNRRPVDFERCARLLAGLDDGQGVPDTLDGAKLLVTSRALRLRRARPGWFDGSASYAPLDARGAAAGHAVAFARAGQVITVATRLPAGLRQRGGWDATVLPLPPGEWRDLLTGHLHSGPAPLAVLAASLPVALLEKT